jgi:hypothetical protein
MDATETHLRELLRLLTERYGGGYNAKLFHLNVRLASVLIAQVGTPAHLYVDNSKQSLTCCL